MNEFVEQVKEFQRIFDPENLSYDKKRLENMTWPECDELLDLRYSLINEEKNELHTAIQRMEDVTYEARRRHKSLSAWLEHCPRDKQEWLDAKKEFADALGDILVVTIGTALACGLDIEKIMERIHESNMTKLDENGEVIYRSDGKVLKGPNYKPPILSDLI